MNLQIVGHRGVAGHCPENTMSSFLKAKDIGLKWVELDVQPTKDGVLVVCHDHTVERCSNGKGRVDQLTLSELKLLDFGRWKGIEFKGERIITLTDLLDFALIADLSLNIEVKIDKYHNADFVADLLADALRQHPINKQKIILSSFSQEMTLALSKKSLDTKLGVLTSRVTRKTLRTIDKVNAFSCHANFRWLSARTIKALREKGVQIWCFTVNNPKSFKYLKDVDGIFTDYPEKFTAR
ncbi:glycerophosphoryl diester phosphodiesterase [Vibrio sp. ZSDZ34]|uniref:Glycerophosphoryl diester phosphodiesterase n=1 Tax=Vibrio gelatinilyticus TaxID=2893468 RepID=A0A9X1W8Z1_9VIBR|nr:glycerophosphodiester phosphodiesterase family protein [Vibrio gelatinilyticus]MCJ2376462.1 glycerophosphoryl diester phosphodiesterase [Vibrio gelatinilyticus]